MADCAEVSVLREKVEQLFAAHVKEHAALADALKLARESDQVRLQAALNSIDHRFDLANETKAMQSQTLANTVSRNEWHMANESIKASVDSMRERLDERLRNIDARINLAAGAAAVIASIITALIAFIVRR